MNYTVKETNGSVKAILKTGKDYVSTVLSRKAVDGLIANGKLSKGPIEGYEICINKEWYFEGTVDEGKKPILKKKGVKE